MTLFFALLFALIAGVINGSYALPTKTIKRWPFESTWLVFSLLTFFLVPWGFLLLLNSHALAIYAQTPTSVLGLLIFGGLLFGFGQIGFAWALDSIGMGLSFVINVGLSTALGPLLPLIFIHSGHIFHTDTYITLVGIVMILAGLLVCYAAGKRRDGLSDSGVSKASQYALGMGAAVVAGLGSVGQNYTFASTAVMQTLALQAGFKPLTASFIIWPGFLTMAFIPYGLYMLYLNVKNKSFASYVTGERRFYFSAVLMAACWFGSLVFYSKASQMVGVLGPVIIWPLFMSLIILTSNFWGWRYGEWKHADAQAKRRLVVGIILFIFAVILFGVAAYLSHHRTM